MAKPKLSLTASPTFKAKVAIPVPGSKSVDVEFVFKGRTKDEYKDWVEKIQEGTRERDDVEVILEVASGWELEEPFDSANIQTLLQNYLGAGQAITDKYIRELTQARLGN